MSEMHTNLENQWRIQSSDINRARKVSLFDIIEKLDIKYYTESGHRKIYCPFHQERHASCAIYEDHYHSYCCGAHGDGIDFLMKVANVDFKTAVVMINGIYEH